MDENNTQKNKTLNGNKPTTHGDLTVAKDDKQSNTTSTLHHNVPTKQEICTGGQDERTEAIKMQSNALQEEFQKNGLDFAFWSKIFQEEVHVNSVQQLQHLKETDLSKLMKHAREDWEKRVLRSLVRNAKYKLCGERLKNVEKDAMESSKRITSNDEEAKTVLETLSQRLTLPKPNWESNKNSSSLNQVLASLELPTAKTTKSIERPIYENNEVVENSSAGLALKGVYVKNNEDEIYATRKTVLQIKDQIIMKEPLLPELDQTVEFTSENQSTQFHRVMTITGANITAFIKVFFGKAGLSYSKSKQNENTVTKSSKQTFYSRIKYFAIPVKSCELTKENVCLTSDAIEGLLWIETINNLCSHEQFINHECNNFFEKYGSHINLGILHFGGIYKWIATFKSEKTCEEDKMKQLVQHSLNCYVTASYPSARETAGAEVSGNITKTYGNASQDFSESDLSSTTLNVLKCGGPTEVDDFETWKYVLTSCNSTWSLIDRGELVGIWELVDNHKSLFKDAIQMKQILQCAWEKRNYEGNVDFAAYSSLVKSLDALVNEIKEWNKCPNSKTCQDILQNMLRMKNSKVNTDGHVLRWIDLLHTDESLYKFFTVVADNNQTYESMAYIKYLLREILNPYQDPRFSTWLRITEWMTPTKSEQLSICMRTKITTVETFIFTVRNSFLPQLISQLHETNESVSLDLAKTLTEMCHECFSYLESSDDKYNTMLLKTGFIKINYNEKDGFFSVYPTHQNIYDFIENIAKQLNQIKEYEKCSPSQAQAFIVLSTVYSLKETYGAQLSEGEDVFDRCVSDVRCVLTDDVISVIDKHTISTPYRWAELELDLIRLKNREEISNSVFSLSFIQPYQYIVWDDNDFQKMYMQQSDEFKSLLKNLGLQSCYPEKLCIIDVIKIENEPLLYKDIAKLFLRNIITCNYRARERLLQQFIEKFHKPGQDSYDDFNDDFNTDEPTSNDSTEVVDESVYPLDIVVAIFLCCSPILKQILTSLFVNCRLAVPLVLPPRTNSCNIDQISLWQFRSLVLERRLANGILRITALNCPCHIVSFIRFDDICISKSNIMNHILDDQSHDTFFHSDCPLGRNYRKICNGLIEAAWKMPLKEENKVTLYLNLRGNAQCFEQQRCLLSDISSIIVVMVRIQHLEDEKSVKLLVDLHKSHGRVIFAVDGKSKSRSNIKTIWGDYKKKLGDLKSKTLFVPLTDDKKCRSVFQITDNIAKEISKLQDTIKEVSLLEQISKINYVKTDESVSAMHQKAFKHVHKMMKLIPSQHADVKKKLVPLQGQPWRNWSTKWKNLQRSSEYVSPKSKQGLRNELSNRRICQLEMIDGLDFIQTFINCLCKASYSCRYLEIFVSCLRMFLDERSRTTLTLIEMELQKLRTRLENAKHYDMEHFELLQSDVNKCESEMITASLGFEHLMREIGQMYEALKEPQIQNRIDKKTKDLALKLPELCAKLILMGQPFELMDGDAGNVPLGWVTAVLCELKKSLGDKKCLILSVLGIQSSGKSTLLNTMFGLQFPVSAGRCTKGIFMQLIPIEVDKYEYNFILAVDTEGLRARQLCHTNYDNDNKLATFVIGLSDITIINVKGENNSELDEILQIALHAFIRLKQTKKRPKLKQSCLFAHQNVSEPTAGHKLEQAHQQLVQKLDESTRIAAESENIADIKHFNQMIEFEFQKDIWYFSDIWQGSPPMAPRNPDYSEHANRLKKYILFQKARTSNVYNTFSDIAVRIEDLWNGVLSDDFVYSFRNSLEISYYNLMTKIYDDIAYKLMIFANTYVTSEVRTQFADCQEAKLLSKVFLNAFQNFTVELDTKRQQLEAELNEVVDKHPRKNELLTLKKNKITSLKLLEEEFLSTMKDKVQQLSEERRLQIDSIKDKTKYKEEIDELASKLASKYEGKIPDENVLERVFREKWVTWMTELASRIPKTPRKCIEDEMFAMLYERFPELAVYLKDCDTKKPKEVYETMKCLEGSLACSDIEKRHFTVNNNSLFPSFNFYTDKKSKELCIEITNILFKIIDEKIKKIITDYDITYINTEVKEIFSTTILYIDEHNNKKSNTVTLKGSYIALVATHVVRYLTVIFERMDSLYHKQHNPQVQLESYKSEAFIRFKGMVKSTCTDVIAAEVFNDTMKREIINHVLNCMPTSVFEEIQPEFPDGKASIIKNILLYLASKGSYRLFFAYIKCPNVYVRRWLTEYIIEHIITPADNEVTSKYFKLAKQKIDQIFTQIAKSLSSSTKHERSASEMMTFPDWMEYFIQDVNASRVLPLSRNCFHSEKSACNVKNFSEHVMNNLDCLKQDILTNFNTTKESTISWRENPQDIIMRMMWGCEATCPFCLEPCKHTNKSHLKEGILHECLQHRIIGAAGHNTDSPWYQFWMKDTLTLNSCDDLIQLDDAEFFCDHKYVSWKNYNRCFPEWDIIQNKNGNIFWIWFVSNYASHIENEYSIKLPTLPPDWKEVTRKQAMESILKNPW